MIKEYLMFIKEYFKLIDIKKIYVIINFLSTFFYKLFSILLPLVSSFIIKYLTDKNIQMSYYYLVILVIIYILYNISLYINYKIYGYIVNYCYDNITYKVLNKLINTDNNFTNYISKGRLVSSINNDILMIGDMCDRISEIIMGIIQVVIVLIIIFFYNIYIALIFILFTILYITLRNRYDRCINYYYNKTLKEDDKYNNLLNQIISGHKEIKTFNIINKFKNKLEIIQNKYNKYYHKERHYYTLRDNDTRLIVYIYRFILYIFLLILLMKNKIDISIVVLIITYHEYLTTYINDLIKSSASIREINVSINRINDILNYNDKSIEIGPVNNKDVNGVIEFKNVSLVINNKNILNNINLKINHNELIVLTGPSGSGKTILLNLLLRLYKPTRGNITLDNINIFDYSKEAYADNISICGQRPFIFNMSIRNNLNFVDKNINNQINACKKVKIHDFIETLPLGYNTILRENGDNISGGQKQLITLARCILSGAEVLLFDDTLKSLDPSYIKVFPSLINDLKKEHTIIMITNQKEILTIADKVVLFENGTINDIDTHSNLLKRNKLYQNLLSKKSISKVEVSI